MRQSVLLVQYHCFDLIKPVKPPASTHHIVYVYGIPVYVYLVYVSIPGIRKYTIYCFELVRRKRFALQRFSFVKTKRSSAGTS